MNVTMTPVSPRCTVADADDPYKKFWFAILAGFACTGFWLLTPMLGEKAIGSTVVGGAPKNEAGVEQALTSADTGAAAATAEDAAKKKLDEGLGHSRLYQAPPEEPAKVETPAAASGSTLADELKKVSRGEGGWTEKAHRGFSSPKLSGGSMSGLNSAVGGRAGSASLLSGMSAFGARNSQVGYAATKNIPAGGTAAASKGVAALQSAATSAKLAAGTVSGDAASGSLNKIFDGAKNQNQIGGQGAGGVAGLSEKFDSAPVNLKLDDPKLDEKKKKAPPAAAPAPPSGKMDDAEVAKQVAMTMAGAFIGGLLPGAGGAMVASIVMQTLQRQEAQMQKISDLQQKQYMDAKARQMGVMPSTQ